MAATRHQLSDGQTDVINTISYVLASLSLLGSLFICVCYVTFTKRRTFGFHLVFLLSINDVCSQFRVVVQFLRLSSSDSGTVRGARSKKSSAQRAIPA